MEFYCAQIEDGLVVRVIVCDSAEWASATHGGEWVLTEQLPGVGWTYADGVFAPPVEPEPPAE